MHLQHDRPVRVYSFDERLVMSEGVVAATVPETIAAFLPGCVAVHYNTDTVTQRAGVDYRATLRGGANVTIDHKAREPGCRRFWKCGPELALEIWSIVPGSLSRDRSVRRTGWCLDEGKKTDYTLHTFDAADSTDAWLLPFQLLRAAFRKHGREWLDRYPDAEQATVGNGHRWRSRCVFVPASVVVQAIAEGMQGSVVRPRRGGAA